MPKYIILVEHQFNRLIQTMIREEIKKKLILMMKLQI